MNRPRIRIAALAILGAQVGLAIADPLPTAPTINPDHTVTFRIKAPDASQVELNSDWPGGNAPTKAQMTKDAIGIWSLTVGPLKPDLWSYWFAVNGVRVPDNVNPHFSYDRWGDGQLSLLFVPGPESTVYEMQDVPHGTVSAVWYPAPSLKLAAKRAIVYTPAGYESGHSRYPVLYLSSNEETGWILLGRAPTILDNLISAGKARPMIVVMLNTQPDSAASSDATDEQLPSTVGLPSRISEKKNENGGNLSGPGMVAGGVSIARDLVPFIDRSYRTLRDRHHRAVAGMSASGAATFYGAATHLDVFGSIGIFSGGFPALPDAWIHVPTPPDPGQYWPNGPDLNQSFDADKVAAMMPNLNDKADLDLLYVSIGANDSLMPTNDKMKKFLDDRGLKYVHVEVPGYHHEWRFWRWSLADYAPRLFKGVKQ
jgi:enterochelin esterase family protein